MYKSEIKDLQDEMKRWQRFRDSCGCRHNIICMHDLTKGVRCGLGICPGGFDEPKGTEFGPGSTPCIG